MIAAQRDSYPVELMCRVLDVSRSGFYAAQARPVSARQQDDTQLSAAIQAAHVQSRGRYGAPRLHRVLRHAGIRVGRKRVARLMRLHGLHGRLRRRWRHVCLLPRRLLTIPNRLARRFAPGLYPRRNQAWSADLSFVRTAEGWLYVAVILDLASRRIVGWATGSSLEDTVVVAALRMALYTRQPAPGLLHHADRGRQYTSVDYQQLLLQHGGVLSYSRPANCWDNAVVESFFATLKTELRIRRARWRTRAEARAAILEYLRWYNEERLHSSIDYYSPVQYEVQVLGASS